jgi:hypothetical protein
MSNAYSDFSKVVDVIQHEENKHIHIPYIEEMIKLYINKYPYESVLCNSLLVHMDELKINLNYEN